MQAMRANNGPNMGGDTVDQKGEMHRIGMGFYTAHRAKNRAK
jgi:hypothetical protein